MTEITGGEGERDLGAADAGSEPVDELAPVIPLFGRRAEQPGTPQESVRQARWGQASPPARSPDRTEHQQPSRPGSSPRARGPRFEPDDDGTDSRGAQDADPQGVHDAAEALLLRRLRTRQLSVSEARGVIIGAEMTTDAADELLERFGHLGYLDDAALAEQLVHVAVERKGQGRQAISPSLSRRGLPRDVVDAALALLPDDDAERALDFARTKARSLGARDRDAALRRLVGQLARRGFPSSVSLTAARQALDEL